MSTRFRIPIRSLRDDPGSRGARRAWYGQPIVWVGAVVFVASMAGCVWLIVVAERYADPPLPVEGLRILTMPLTRPSPQAP